MKTAAESANNTAAYVTCHGGLVEGDKGCGTQPLTEPEYRHQLSMPNRGWHCPKCGNSADYNDTESERVQGVNDDATQPPVITAEERKRVLDLISAAMDEPNPECFEEKSRAVIDASNTERKLFGYRTLIEAALFIDDAAVDHPELDAACLRRLAASQLISCALLIIHGARRMEGTEFNPARIAFVMFNHAEEFKRGTEPKEAALFVRGMPGEFRAWCESEGICQPRKPHADTEPQS